MKLYVGVTGNDWHRFLRSRPDFSLLCERPVSIVSWGSEQTRLVAAMLLGVPR
jgi:hypothetical protein